MTNLFAQLARAAAAGAAMETGRSAVRRNGLGFAAGDQYDGSGDYFYDDFGNYWEWDWFNYNDGSDFQAYLLDYSEPGLNYVTDPYSNTPDFSDWTNYYRYGPDAFLQTSEQSPLPRGFDPFALPPFDPYRDIWPWLNDRGPGPAQLDPSGQPQQLPGYCPRGTYHPVNDPYACVPFPADNNEAKKRAQQQQQTRQQAAQAMRRAQQQRDRQCPKLPNGQATVFNPQTGKCEAVPPCQQGTKFDSTTRRCLTPAQAKELYGDNSWLWWLLIGGGVLLIATRDNGGGRRR